MKNQMNGVATRAVSLSLFLLLAVQASLMGDEQIAPTYEQEMHRKNKVRIVIADTVEAYLKNLVHLSYKKGVGSTVKNIERVLKTIAVKARWIDVATLELAADEALAALEVHQTLLSLEYYSDAKADLEEFRKNPTGGVSNPEATKPVPDGEEKIYLLAGDVTGHLKNSVVEQVGGKKAAEIAAAVAFVLEATPQAVANSAVTRDATGNFEANTITAQSFNGVFNGVLNGTVNDKTATQPAGCVDCLADRRSIINVRPCELGLNFIKDLRPVGYQLKDESSVTKKTYGMLAQDIGEVIKKHHAEDFGGYDYNQSSDKYRLRYNDFIAPIIKAVQELALQNQEMRKHIELLESKIG